METSSHSFAGDTELGGSQPKDRQSREEAD